MFVNIRNVFPQILFLYLFIPLQDRTNNLFKQVYEQKSLKGRANDAIASACLYIACRQEGVPRTFKGRTQLPQSSSMKVDGDVIGFCAKNLHLKRVSELYFATGVMGKKR